MLRNVVSSSAITPIRARLFAANTFSPSGRLPLHADASSRFYSVASRPPPEHASAALIRAEVDRILGRHTAPTVPTPYHLPPKQPLNTIGGDNSRAEPFLRELLEETRHLREQRQAEILAEQRRAQQQQQQSQQLLSRQQNLIAGRERTSSGVTTPLVFLPIILALTFLVYRWSGEELGNEAMHDAQLAKKNLPALRRLQAQRAEQHKRTIAFLIQRNKAIKQATDTVMKATSAAGGSTPATRAVSAESARTVGAAVAAASSGLRTGDIVALHKLCLQQALFERSGIFAFARAHELVHLHGTRVLQQLPTSLVSSLFGGTKKTLTAADCQRLIARAHQRLAVLETVTRIMVQRAFRRQVANSEVAKAQKRIAAKAQR